MWLQQMVLKQKRLDEEMNFDQTVQRIKDLFCWTSMKLFRNNPIFHYFDFILYFDNWNSNSSFLKRRRKQFAFT